MTSKSIPRRSEVWLVDLNPTRGSEIGKVRTAVVLSSDSLGRLPLHIIVPLTEWQPSFAAYPWFTKLTPTAANGLMKESGADSFQIKSVARERFVKRLGALAFTQMEAITYCVALCIGMNPNWGNS